MRALGTLGRHLCHGLYEHTRHEPDLPDPPDLDPTVSPAWPSTSPCASVAGCSPSWPKADRHGEPRRRPGTSAPGGDPALTRPGSPIVLGDSVGRRPLRDKDTVGGAISL